MQPHDTTQDIPYGFCKCGCGQKTRTAPQTRAARGWVRGEPMRYLPNHHKFMLRPKEAPNPSGLCMCGCGQKAPIAKVSRTGKGWIKGQPKKFIAGHGPVAKNINKAFWIYVTPKAPSDCWLWQGGISPSGYGRAHIQGKEIPAHRLSWEIHNGPIPESLFVCHHCDIKNCVNPAHLFLGTARDNTLDMIAKGRNGGYKKGHPYYPRHK